ncbi:MAG: DUF167 domain-containing protein [Treponema sp.]|jgi:uncharacterized protein (TIGR00251 family)|nr:DUF167 domain-containing protein [Treponema sp.]
MEGGSCIRVSGNLLYLDVKALPGASRSQVLGLGAGRLRVKVAAAPQDGKANQELCTYLAKLLNCPRKAVSLCSGEKSRLKTLRLPLSAKEKLEALLQEQWTLPAQGP